MVDKIEIGKRYRVDMSQLCYDPFKGDIEKYSNNGIILISYIGDDGIGIWNFKKENGENSHWWFDKEDLIPLREEAFLEIFKEEIYG